MFRELDLMEEWGSGYRRIQDDCHAGGYPVPEWEELASVVRVEFQPHADSLDQRGVAYDEVDEQVGEQVVRMLKACRRNPRTKQELLESANLANAYLNYRRHIVPLLDEGLLERTIPDKPNSRNQKYRLTDKGRAVLKELES